MFLVGWPTRYIEGCAECHVIWSKNKSALLGGGVVLGCVVMGGVFFNVKAFAVTIPPQKFGFMLLPTR